jgi:hypothetical protein
MRELNLTNLPIVQGTLGRWYVIEQNPDGTWFQRGGPYRTRDDARDPLGSETSEGASIWPTQLNADVAQGYTGWHVVTHESKGHWVTVAGPFKKRRAARKSLSTWSGAQKSTMYDPWEGSLEILCSKSAPEIVCCPLGWAIVSRTERGDKRVCDGPFPTRKEAMEAVGEWKKVRRILEVEKAIRASDVQALPRIFGNQADRPLA